MRGARGESESTREGVGSASYTRRGSSTPPSVALVACVQLSEPDDGERRDVYALANLGDVAKRKARRASVLTGAAW